MRRDPISFYFNPDADIVSILASTSEFYVIKSILEPNQVKIFLSTSIFVFQLSLTNLYLRYARMM